MLAGDGLQRFRVAVQLLFAVRQMDQGYHREHHPLIPGGEIVQHLAGLLSLLLQIIRHDRGEVVVAVLAALPVGHVGLHPQQAVLHLPHRLIRRDGDDVNGQHEAPVQAGEFVDHGVFDVAGVLLQKQHPAILIAHDKVVLLKLHAVRADGVLKGAAMLYALPQIQLKLRFFAHAIEVMKDSEPLHSVQFLAAGVHAVQAGDRVVDRAVEKGACFLNVLLMDGQCDAALLHHTVGGVRHLIQQHGVVLRPGPIQIISLGRDEKLLFEVPTVDPLVVDGDFGRRAGIQSVQQL